MKIKMKRSIRKKFKFGFNAFTLILIYFVLITGAATGRYIFDKMAERNAKITNDEENKVIATETPKEEIGNNKIKDKVLLGISYTVQAPLGNWNIHEESCEEAAILMSHYYLNEIPVAGTVISKEAANKELIDLIEWQKSHYGSEKDLSMTELGQLFKDYYGHRFEVKSNVTENDIKKELSDGNPVVMPVMTQSLHNPNYRPSSVYHVVLIKGYDETGVITNDAGVKEGENWHYNWNIVWEAMDAQTPKMGQGRDILVLKK